MTRLLELQELFQSIMDKDPDVMFDQVCATAQFSKEERLGVYTFAYTARLQEVLTSDYPKLQAWMGVKRFDQLTEAYIKENPSTFRSLRWYGANFSNWILESSGVKYAKLLAELAEFEWKMLAALDAQDISSLSMQQVSALMPEQWPELFLRMHPSVQLFNCEYKVVAIWKSLEQNKRAKLVQKPGARVFWRIWRQSHIAYFRSITVSEAWALDKMQSGISFADLCSGLCDFVPEEEAPMHAATLLKTWIQDEVLLSL